jgi:hypothetical protein
MQRVGPAQQPALIIQQPLLSPAALAAAGALVQKLRLQLQQLPVRAALLQEQQRGTGVVSGVNALAAAAAASGQAAAALEALYTSSSSTTTTTSSRSSSTEQSTVLVVSKLGVSAAELAAHLQAAPAPQATSHRDSHSITSSSNGTASQQLTSGAAAAPGTSQLVGLHLHVSC